MKYLKRLFDFLYDFLVGDSWELFVGPLVVLLAGWLLLQAGVVAAVVGVLVFVGVLTVAGLNLWVALKGAA